MSAPISCIVIKSDHLPRKIPALGEMVRVVDRSGLFVVITTDRERRSVTLIEKGGGNHRLVDVPFASLRTLNNSLDRTIRRFLDSAGHPKGDERRHEPQPLRSHSQLAVRMTGKAGNDVRAVDSELIMSCLFCQIVDGSIPSKAIYQDDKCYAFGDIKPVAPVHVLVVPREHIASTAHAAKEHKELLGHLLWVAAEIARSKGLEHGYRTVINTGDDGGQTVDHIHVHLLGGRHLTWPPG